MDRSTLGAASELLVAINLMSKGWEVYRNLAPSGIDLMAHKRGTLIRVEVKTSRGTLAQLRKYPGCVLAVVIGGNVIYYSLENEAMVEITP